MQLPVVIAGAGVAGLVTALSLHQRGILSRVYEVAPEIKNLGVGITMLPHAMRELTALGLQQKVLAAGVENYNSAFFNRFGQLIYQEPRGRRAGYSVPEVGIHRGRLHTILYEAACEKLGRDRVVLNRRCVGVEQNDAHVVLRFQETTTGAMADPVRADIALACDGVNSAVRKHFYPDEELAFEGINTWRGVTIHKPILTGKSYLRIGSIDTGKMVIYPIVDNIDGQGNQLINWMAEIRQPGEKMNDWNKSGDEAIKDYQKGQMVKVKVLDTDVEKERISLGIKQLSGDPFKEAMDTVNKGDIVTCTVKAIGDKGIDVDVNGAPGFIRKADLARDRSEQRPDRFSVGDKVDAVVTAVDRTSHKIQLSIKTREIDEEKKAMAQYGSSDSGASLGDILGAALSRARNATPNGATE